MTFTACEFEAAWEAIQHRNVEGRGVAIYYDGRNLVIDETGCRSPHGRGRGVRLPDGSPNAGRHVPYHEGSSKRLRRPKPPTLAHVAAGQAVWPVLPAGCSFATRANVTAVSPASSRSGNRYRTGRPSP